MFYLSLSFTLRNFTAKLEIVSIIIQSKASIKGLSTEYTIIFVMRKKLQWFYTLCIMCLM